MHEVVFWDVPKKGHDSQNCNGNTSSAIRTRILTIQRAVNVSCSHSGKINNPAVPQLQLMTVRISRVTEDVPAHNQIYWTSSAHVRMQFYLLFFFCLNIFLLARSQYSEVVRQQCGERDEEKQRWRTGGRREFSPGNTVSVKKINTRGPKVKEEVKKQISPTIRASQLPVGTSTTKKDFPRQVCACVRAHVRVHVCLWAAIHCTGGKDFTVYWVNVILVLFIQNPNCLADNYLFYSLGFFIYEQTAKKASEWRPECVLSRAKAEILYVGAQTGRLRRETCWLKPWNGFSIGEAFMESFTVLWRRQPASLHDRRWSLKGPRRWVRFTMKVFLFKDGLFPSVFQWLLCELVGLNQRALRSLVVLSFDDAERRQQRKTRCSS